MGSLESLSRNNQYFKMLTDILNDKDVNLRDLPTPIGDSERKITRILEDAKKAVDNGNAYPRIYASVSNIIAIMAATILEYPLSFKDSDDFRNIIEEIKDSSNMEFINIVENYDISLKVKDIIKNYNFSDIVNAIISSYDFSTIVNDFIKEYDFNPEVKDIIKNYNFSDIIYAFINSYNFNPKVSEVIKSYDFSNIINNFLKTYNFNPKVSDIIKSYDFSNIISAFLPGYDFSSIINKTLKKKIITVNESDWQEVTNSTDDKYLGTQTFIYTLSAENINLYNFEKIIDNDNNEIYCTIYKNNGSMILVSDEKFNGKLYITQNIGE